MARSITFVSAVFAMAALGADDGHVSVFAAPAGSYAPNAAGQSTREAVAREFFSTHSDSYDFLIVFPAFQTGFVDEAGLHTFVRSDVGGLGAGLPPHDVGAAFGSASRLKGYLDVRALDPTQPALSVDSAVNVAAHELEHQFAAFVELQLSGVAADALRGRNASHWSFFFDSDGSVLYGSDWVAGQTPGTWRAESSLRRYSALDLYLMGLLAPAEVPAMQLLEPTSSSLFLSTDLPPPDGTIISASPRGIRIEDVIAANGPRTPNTSTSQKSFRAAFVLLLAPGQSVATPAQVQFVDSVRRRFANDFFFMTRGRAVMQTDLLETPPAPLASTPDLRRAVDYLLSRQEVSGEWRDTPSSQLRDTQLALEALSSFASDPRVEPALQRGGGSLSQSAPDGVDAAARRALGLLAAHQPLSSVSASLDSYVDRNGLNADFGYGYARGYASTVLDTMLALQALEASGAAPATLSQTRAWLVSRQNSDGGWPVGGAGESRVGISALVLATLAGQPAGSPGAQAAARGFQFLRSRAAANGSFGEADSLAPTALSLLALDAWAELTPAEGTAGTQFLLTRQWSDGSFGGAVAETAIVVKALRRLRTPNLQLSEGDVTVSRSQTLDGDLVQLSATIHNTGYVASPASTIQVLDSSGSLLAPLQVVPAIAAGAATTVTLVLDTTGHGGSSQLFVAVDPDGLLDETREDDNRAALPLQIFPPPQGPELAVGALALAAPLSSLPGTVSLTAAIHNVGLTEALGAVVELQVGGQSFRAQVDLAARSVAAVPLSVVLTQLSTPLIATVVVDPDGQIAEPIEDNNSATIAVPVTPTVQVGVGQLVATPSTANQGQSIAVSFAVANLGTADASDARAEVRLKDPSGALVMTLSSLAIPTLAGGVTSKIVTVRVPVAGTWLLEVLVGATGDTTPGDNSATVGLVISASSLANLTVSPGALTISPEPPLQGVGSTLTAIVSNPGASTASGAVFELWAGAPQTGTRIDRRTLPDLPAGGSTSVAVSWTPSTSAPVDLFTVVDSDQSVEEYDEADNVTTLRVEARSLADLELLSGDLQFPNAPQPGAPLPVEVFVRNLGEQDAVAPSLSLYLGTPSTGVLVWTSVLPMLEGGAETHATFSVPTTGLTGPQQLTAVVTTTSVETQSNNNEAGRQFTVQSGPVTASNLYFSPNGDGVKDDTEITFTQATAQAVRIVIDDARGNTIREYPLAPSAIGSVTWDGQDSNARIAPDGAYRASVVAGGVTLGSVSLTLDLNRSQLADAVGTPFLELEYLGGGDGLLNPRPSDGISPAGDDVAFISDDYWNGITYCGVFYRPRGGGETVRETADSVNCSDDLSYVLGPWSMSHDGQRLAYVYADDSLRLFDRHTKSIVKLVAPEYSLGVWVQSFPPVFSPDGTQLFFVSGCGGNCSGGRYRYEVIRTDGTQRRVLWQSQSYPSTARFSPDGTSVAWMADNLMLSRAGAAPLVLLTPPGEWRSSGGWWAPPLFAWKSDSEIVTGLGGGTPVQKLDVGTGAVTTLLDGGFEGVSLNPSSEAFFTATRRRNIPCPGTEPRDECGYEDPSRAWVHRPGNPQPGLLREGGDSFSGQLSTAGDFMAFPDGYVAGSLANLTNRFTPRRAAGEVAFTFSGTLTDLNFDSWELTARGLQPVSPLTTVARGYAPTLSGAFAQWIPSAAGLYELKLSVRDLAGNVLTRTTQVVSPDTSVRLSNVQRAPEVFSPNGDGKKDDAQLTYEASGPLTFAVDVRAVDGGAVVKTLAQTVLAAGRSGFNWDGRTDVGSVASEGDYLLELEGARIPVALDVTPPQLTFEWNHQIGNVYHEFARTKVEGRTCGDPSGPRREIPAIAALYRHQAADPHLKHWKLEASGAFSPTGFTSFSTGAGALQQLGSIPLTQFAGRSYRLEAEDQADNVAVTPASQPAERLFVVGAHATSGPDFGCVQLAGGRHVAALDAFTAVEGPITSAAELRFKDFTLGSFGIALTNSIAEPITEVRAEVTDGGMVIPAAVSSNPDLVVLDTSNAVPAAFQVLLTATTSTGRIFTASLNVVGGELVPGACAGPVGVDQARIEIEQSGTSGTVSFRRSSDGQVEQTTPWTGNGLYDTSQLTQCRYQLEVTFSSVTGQSLNFSENLDVCGVFVESTSFASGEVSVTARARLVGAMTSVSLLASGSGTTWTELASQPGFQGSTTLTAPLPASLGCGELEVRLIARMADGTTYDSVATSGCSPLPRQLTVSCFRLVAEAPVRTNTADWCQVNVPTWQVRGQANQPLASLTAELFPLLGQPRTTLPISFAPGASSGVASVETLSLAEGSWLVGFSGTDQQGGAARATLAEAEAIIVDRVPPAVTLTTPTSGRICPSAILQANGTRSLQFDVSGTVSDGSLEGWAVLLRQPNQAQPQAVFETTLELAGSRQVTASVAADAIPSGEYELFLGARDVSGTSTCTPSALVTIQQPVAIAQAAALIPALISPDGDGVLELTAGSINLTAPAEVTVEVLRAGVLMGTASQLTLPAGVHALTWNGTVAGQVLPDGPYRLRVTATDTCAHSEQVVLAETIVIDTTMPIAQVTAPLSNGSVQASVTVTGIATDDNFQDLQLSFGAGAAPSSWAQVASSPQEVPGAALGTIDFAHLAAGPYSIRLVVRDRAGHSRTEVITVDLQPVTALTAFAFQPLIASPEGDGLNDTAWASVTLAVQATVTIELLRNGTLIHTLASGVTQPAGTTSYPLSEQQLLALGDGPVEARLQVGSETATGSIEIDSQPPQLVVSQPGPGFVAGRTPVAISVTDPHLAAWELTHRAPDGTVTPLADGLGAPGVIADLVGLADGPHTLELRAEDSAGHSSLVTAAFSSDRTAPQVAFRSPLALALLSGARGPQLVSVDVTEQNVAEVRLEWSPASGPSTVISTSSSVPASGVIASWDVASQADGPGQLTVTITDLAGNSADAVLSLTLDSMAPSVTVTSPTPGPINLLTSVVGSVEDATLQGYRVLLGQGPASTASFVEIGSGAAPVVNGILAQAAGQPQDGPWTIRVSAIDAAGNERQVDVFLEVDTVPPAAPLGLSAQVERPSTVALSWQASTSTDLGGYLVYRAQTSGAFTQITASPVASTTLQDVVPADGNWSYFVRAVDLAGNVSPDSNVVGAAVDGTPPQAYLTAPAPAAVLSGVSEVRGSAFAADLREYRVSIGSGAAPASFTLLRRNTVGVPFGVLAEVDTAILVQGASYTLLLEAEDFAGNVADDQVTFQTDNLSPAAPVLLSAVATQRTVLVSWQAPSDSDLRGYLLYRDGAIANAPPGQSFPDITPFLLSAATLSFSDLNVADGTHRYELQAVDQALNLSPISNFAQVTVELRAPVATIASPLNLAQVGPVTQVIAQVADQDVRSVQFELRVPPAVNFAPLGPPRTNPPFVATLDTTQFPAASGFELRAIAEDLSGNVDGAPVSVVVFRDEPLSLQVTTRVDGSAVLLSWTGQGGEAFEVEQDGYGRLAPYPPEPTGQASASSEQPGFPPSFGADTDTSNSWKAQPGFPQDWELTLTTPTFLTWYGFIVEAGAVVDVSAKISGVWVSLGRQTADYGDVRASLPAPLKVEAMRLHFLSSPTVASVSYTGLNPLQAVAGSPFVTSPRRGVWQYTVRAWSRYGASVERRTSAHVYRPALSPLVSPVPAPSIQVGGTGAEAGAQIDLSVNGATVAQAQADATGAFSGSVPLALAGTNFISAVATDALGNRSQPAANVTTVYAPPPTAALQLALDAVTGSTVAFSFVATGVTADISGFELRRSAGGVSTTVAMLAASQTTAIDTNVPNGTHEYVLVAHNADGFFGAPSNTVVATLSLPPPVAPTLVSATAVAAGEAVDLSWTHPGTPADFVVERALAPAGGFSVAGTSASLALQDVGLTNGVAYLYRVRARDAAGNQSAPSNLLTVTPVDLMAPESPRITAPTVPGTPITVTNTNAEVRGFAELGSEVELFRNGASQGRSVVTNERLVLDPLDATAGAVAGSLSPDKTKLAAFVTNQSGAYELTIETLATHQSVAFPAPAGATELTYRPAWSPDGTQVAILCNRASDGTRRVYVGEATSGLLTPLPSSVFRNDSVPSFSPDSRRVAFESGSGVTVHELTSGLETVSPQRLYSPIWLPDSMSLVGLGDLAGGGRGLVRFELANSQTTDLVSIDDYVYSMPALDPTGRWLAVAAESRQSYGAGLLTIYDLTTRTSRVAYSSQGSIPSSPSWAPDGTSVTFVSQNQLYRATPTGMPTVLGPVPGAPQVFQLAGGEFLIDVGTELKLGFLAGEFVFPGVALSRGLNGFHAIARDAAGHSSQASESISVTSSPTAPVDLSVSIQLQPAVIQPGDPITAVVNVRNAGPAAVIAPAVAVTLARADGTLAILPQMRLATLAAGGAQTVLFDVPTSGLAGAGHTVMVTVDPALETSDTDRTNNRASTPLVVATPGATPSVALSLGAPDLSATGSTVATVVVTNPGAPTSLTVAVRMLDATGTLVAALGATESYSPLPAAASLTISRIVSAAGLVPGDYEIEVVATDGGAVISRASAPVRVVADRAARLTLSSVHSVLQAGETVVLDAVVFNDSANATLTGASLSLLISGGAAPHQDLANVPILPPGSSATLSFSVPASLLGGGTFLASSALTLSTSTLAATTASFTVVSSAALVGSISLSGGGSPPATRRGQTAAAALEVINIGTAPSNAQVATVEFVDAISGSILSTQSTPVGALAPGLVFQASLSASTAGWPIGPYVARAMLDDGGARTSIASAAFEVIDGAGPRLTLRSPAQGSLVAGAFAVQLDAEDDSSGVASVMLSLDGAAASPFSLVTGTSLSGFWAAQLTGLTEGPHALAVTALDAEGNASSPLSWSVIVDTVAPVVQWVNVVDGAEYDAPLTPVWVVNDLHFQSAGATLDGQPFVAGGTITGEGQHRLDVMAMDAAGNVGRATASFGIDTVAPTLTLTGVRDGQVSAQTVAPHVSATDRNLASLTVTLDGAPFVSGSPISAEGEYLLEATALDRAGHSQQLSVRFAIDRTPPLVSLGGFIEGEVTQANVTPVVTASDLHLVGTALELNGVGVSSATIVTTEGAWTLEAIAVDAAGNQATAVGHFTIDRTGPVVVILGINAGEVSRVAVTPTIQTEAGAAVSVQLDGAPYQLGTPIAAEGAHLLIATATDSAGNTGTAQVSFAIDLTPPLITFSGVTEGGSYAAPVTVQAFASDAHPPVSLALSLDGQPFGQGGLVQSEGPHVLTAIATDLVGNFAEATVHFTLDFTSPILTINGIAPNGISAVPVTLTWSAVDVNPVTFTATLDGSPVVSGVVVSSEGPHDLTVVATDAAGNATTQNLAFVIDLTPPVITVSGVLDGSLVATPLTISFSATDTWLASVSATLDGAPFSSGTVVSSEGAHELVVVASDTAGHVTTLRVRVTIDLSAPVITIGGVTDGEVGVSFSPTFTVTDASPVTVVALLDGATFSSGSSVQTVGPHTLEVSATDAAGNSSSRVVHFTVSAQSSRPVFRFAACGISSVRLDSGSQVRGVAGGFGSVASNGNVVLRNNTQVIGDLVAGSDLGLANHAFVAGRGYYGGHLSLGNNASLAQGSQQLSQAPTPCDCAYDLSTALKDVASANDNQLLAGLPGYAAGRLVVTTGTVRLPAGRFALSSIEVRSNARLTTAAGASVELYVAGSVVVRNNAFMGAAPGSPPLLVVSGASGTTPVELKNNAVGGLLLYAPDARVEIQNNATLNGAVVGRDVHLTNNQTLILDGLTQVTPPPLVCQ